MDNATSDKINDIVSSNASCALDQALSYKNVHESIAAYAVNVVDTLIEEKLGQHERTAVTLYYAKIAHEIAKLEESRTGAWKKTRAEEAGTTADFTVENHGSIVLFRPNNENAVAWLRETSPEDARFMGAAMAVEPRYLSGVVSAAQADGLSVHIP